MASGSPGGDPRDELIDAGSGDERDAADTDRHHAAVSHAAAAAGVDNGEAGDVAPLPLHPGRRLTFDGEEDQPTAGAGAAAVNPERDDGIEPVAYSQVALRAIFLTYATVEHGEPRMSAWSGAAPTPRRHDLPQAAGDLPPVSQASPNLRRCWPTAPIC